MSMQKIYTIKQDEKGFASIVIALTMIIVLALLAIGFAQLARREQQSALDKQLSTQAYYAAETGINDVRKYIKSGAINTATNLNTDKCLEGGPIDASKDIDTGTGVAYTCVIANLIPKSLLFTSVQEDSSKAMNFQTTDALGNPVSLQNLTIEWQSDGATANASTELKKFLSRTEWASKGYPSVIQFAITPYNSAAVNSDVLAKNTHTSYLYPGDGLGAELPYSARNGGPGGINDIGCDTDLKCSVTITGISSVAGANNYLMHFVNIYSKSNITITGKDTSNNDVHFKGGQAMVDVTGKARNALKRIQVRIPMSEQIALPAYSLEARNICKRIKAQPSLTSFERPGGYTPTSQTATCDLLP